jgi:class 3 adenylate cyclase/pimeloyl-ACP methyl ester carboxylesterase
MMERDIRYCTSRDGTTIAYADQSGAPPPIVTVGHSVIPQVALTMQDEDPSLWPLSGVFQQRRHVRFDRRGIGYSQREVGTLDAEQQIDDLAAVIEHMNASEIDLVGLGDGCMVAAAYAARFPERIRRMALVQPWSETVEQAAAMSALIRSNWGLGRQTLVDVSYGSTGVTSEQRHERARAIREMMTAEVAASYTELASRWVPGPELSTIKTPTTVFVRGVRKGVSGARAFLAVIPNARLQPLHGAGLEGVGEYLQGTHHTATSPTRRPAERPAGRGTAIILFADIVGSTALTERLGDAAFRERARALDTALRAAITAAGGTTIEGKLVGDGVLATFPAASQAIEAALRCAAAGHEGGLPLHVGIHAGDVIHEQDNVYGGAVNIASRISALSAPGEVLVSDIVRGLARTSAGVTFEDRGEHSLKGVTDPQRVYAVTPAP